MVDNQDNLKFEIMFICKKNFNIISNCKFVIWYMMRYINREFFVDLDIWVFYMLSC